MTRFQFYLMIFALLSGIGCIFHATTSMNNQRKKELTIRKEYITRHFDNDGRPMDSTISSITILDSNNRPLKETQYYQGKLRWNYIFSYNPSSFIPSHKDLNDSNVIYVIKDTISRVEYQYNEGLLIKKKYYDKYNNLKKDISYTTDFLNNKDSIIIEYSYFYRNHRIIYESRIAEGVLWYKLQDFYTQGGNLIEKQYLYYDCCATQQPIPPDRIIYKYDSHNNLIKKMSIIDRNIRRKYKDQNNGYFNQVNITTYQYGKYNRLIEKIKYIENDSNNPKIPLDSLYSPRTPLEAHLYKYSHE